MYQLARQRCVVVANRQRDRNGDCLTKFDRAFNAHDRPSNVLCPSIWKAQIATGQTRLVDRQVELFPQLFIDIVNDRDSLDGASLVGDDDLKLDIRTGSQRIAGRLLSKGELDCLIEAKNNLFLTVIIIVEKRRYWSSCVGAVIVDVVVGVCLDRISRRSNRLEKIVAENCIHRRVDVGDGVAVNIERSRNFGLAHVHTNRWVNDRKHDRNVHSVSRLENFGEFEDCAAAYKSSNFSVGLVGLGFIEHRILGNVLGHPNISHWMVALILYGYHEGRLKNFSSRVNYVVLTWCQIVDQRDVVDRKASHIVIVFVSGVVRDDVIARFSVARRLCVVALISIWSGVSVDKSCTRTCLERVTVS